MGGGGRVKQIVKKAAIATGIGGLVGGAGGAVLGSLGGAAVGVGQNIGDEAASQVKFPDAPELGDVDGGLASDAELQDKLLRRKGRASTILTGPQGISNVGDTNIRRRTLLAF